MSIRLNGFPFDSQITGYGADGLPEYDRASNSEEFASLLRGFWRDGVFGTSALAVLAGTGLTATVGIGSVLIQGRVAKVTAAKTLTFDTASSQPRFDRVVARCDLSNAVRDIVLDVVKGTPAASPVAPALTRNQSVWELCLATVRIPAGATAIQQSNITDTRMDNNLCGLVAATMTEVDTSRFYDQVQGDLSDFRVNEQAKLSEFFAKRQEDFDVWFNNLQEIIGEDAAANLARKIIVLEGDVDKLYKGLLGAFQTYGHTKTGTVHELTLEGGSNINLKFVATAGFNAGDTFTLNGEPVNALMPDGNELSDGYFLEGAVVIGFYNGQTNTVYFVGGGSSNTPVTITLTSTGGISTAGRTVTITNTEDESILEQFVYDGQPHTALVPVAARYRVSVDAMAEHRTPDPVEYTAVANTPRSITMTYKFGVRYGFRREKANSSPDGRITYLYDAVGMTPMAVDLTTGEPNYGSWKDFVDELCRPVMLRYDGTVDYELDHNDQTKRADNGEASDVADTAYGGNAMVEFHGFKWVHRSEDASFEYVIFSDIQYDETYHAYAHTNASGKVKDAFYWGMYKGTYDGSRMRSIGAGNLMVSVTRNTEITRAQANGSGTDQETNGYYTIYKSGWDYIADLLTLLSKSDDSQASFGAGRSKVSNAIGAGSLKEKSAFYGSSNGSDEVKVLYVESFWGNVWEGIAGMILDGANGFKTKMVPPYNADGNGYTATGIVPSGNTGGYVSANSCTDESGYVPKIVKGSGTTYMCDVLWFNNGKKNYGLVGGHWDNNEWAGSRSLRIQHSATENFNYVSSRLSYVPV